MTPAENARLDQLDTRARRAIIRATVAIVAAEALLQGKAFRRHPERN